MGWRVPARKGGGHCHSVFSSQRAPQRMGFSLTKEAEAKKGKMGEGSGSWTCIKCRSGQGMRTRGELLYYAYSHADDLTLIMAIFRFRLGRWPISTPASVIGDE